MNEQLWHQVNAVFGSLAVTIGLWLLLGAIPLPLGIAMGIGLAILLAWKCPSIGYIWAVCTLLLGVESMAWAMTQVTDLQKLGREPTMEEMEQMFPGVLLGLFSGVFWLTFAYGIYKRIQAPIIHTPFPEPASSSSPPKKKSKKKSRQS